MYTQFTAPFRIAHQHHDAYNGNNILQAIVRDGVSKFGVRDTDPVISETVNNTEAHRQMCDLQIYIAQTNINRSDADLMDVWAKYRS